MSGAWHWLVIIGTVGTLVGALVLLFTNRRTGGNPTSGHEADGITELNNPLPMWWVWMFALSVIFAAGYLVYYPGLGNFDGLGAWTSDAELAAAVTEHDERFAPLYAQLGDLDPAALHEDRLARQVGRRLYLNNCATCHGVNGRGSPGFPNLTDDEWLWGGDFTAVKTTILHGRRAAMPALGPALGEDGVLAVAHYVRRLAGLEHDANAAASGETSYRTLCAACHGVDGGGNTLLGAPDLRNDVWLYGGTLADIASSIRNGRNGMMPAQSPVLGEAKSHVVAAYVTSLGQ